MVPKTDPPLQSTKLATISPSASSVAQVPTGVKLPSARAWRLNPTKEAGGLATEAIFNRTLFCSKTVDVTSNAEFSCGPVLTVLTSCLSAKGSSQGSPLLLGLPVLLAGVTAVVSVRLLGVVISTLPDSTLLFPSGPTGGAGGCGETIGPMPTGATSGVGGF